MKRRNFLKQGSAIVLPALLNGFTIKAFSRDSFLNSMLRYADPASERVLVVIQLFGGNDGLNTIIPLHCYNNYFNARKNLAIPENKILPVQGINSLGWHPALSGFRDLYNDGKLAALQSVGYPSPNFSHFRSSDIWMSAADAMQTLNTGWAGRYLNHLYPEYPEVYPNDAMPDPVAVQVGNATSFMFQGERSPMAINVADPDNIFNLTNGFTDVAPRTNGGKQLDFVRVVAEKTQVYSQVIKQVAGKVKQQAIYPANNELANQLKIVARLIGGGLKTKLYLVSFDGFDTHAQQANANDTTTGRHADLLKTIGDAISAFQSDLEYLRIHERVMGVTFSEFGRRIASNDSLGTDHGAAAPMFVFGAGVKGGMYGKAPVIAEKITHEDNLAMDIDFRSVYASLLKDWMQVPASGVGQVLPGHSTTVHFIKPI